MHHTWDHDLFIAKSNFAIHHAPCSSDHMSYLCCSLPMTLPTNSFSAADHVDIHLVHLPSGLSLVTIARSLTFWHEHSRHELHGELWFKLAMQASHCRAEAYDALAQASSTTNQHAADERRSPMRRLTGTCHFSLNDLAPTIRCNRPHDRGLRCVRLAFRHC